MWHSAIRLPVPPGPPELHQEMWLQPTQAGFSKDNRCRQAGCADTGVCGQLMVWHLWRWLHLRVLIADISYLWYVCKGCNLASSYRVEKSQLCHSEQIDTVWGGNTRHTSDLLTSVHQPLPPEAMHGQEALRIGQHRHCQWGCSLGSWPGDICSP